MKDASADLYVFLKDFSGSGVMEALAEFDVSVAAIFKVRLEDAKSSGEKVISGDWDKLKQVRCIRSFEFVIPSLYCDQFILNLFHSIPHHTCSSFIRLSCLWWMFYVSLPLYFYGRISDYICILALKVESHLFMLFTMNGKIFLIL